ncbi:MAG: hypothetical protein GTO28_08830, partial [Gammaproteobacteria bacterium]|nr:hypothetical protein [Gammaproteobacteria bacterium]NIQ26840.1 hypothetical protein [Gammaproteobacteria bacterium]
AFQLPGQLLGLLGKLPLRASTATLPLRFTRPGSRALVFLLLTARQLLKFLQRLVELLVNL